MAMANRELVGKALELLRDGLAPFVARELYGKHDVNDSAPTDHRPVTRRDVADLFKSILGNWQLVFQNSLDRTSRTLVHELRDWRNKWAHQESLSQDDVYRILDSASRLLTAVSAPQATELEMLKTEMLRSRFDPQAQENRPLATSNAMESGAVDPRVRPSDQQTVGHESGYIEIREPVVLLSIARSFYEGCNVYEAVRYAWVVNVDRIRRYKLVLAHVRGSVKGAFRPTQWLPATVENFPPKNDAPGRRTNDMPGRYGFVGERAEAAVWNLYVGKQVPAKYLGGQSPVRYCET